MKDALFTVLLATLIPFIISLTLWVRKRTREPVDPAKPSKPPENPTNSLRVFDPPSEDKGGCA